MRSRRGVTGLTYPVDELNAEDALGVYVADEIEPYTVDELDVYADEGGYPEETLEGYVVTE